jgi:hypothetical protein
MIIGQFILVPRSVADYWNCCGDASPPPPDVFFGAAFFAAGFFAAGFVGAFFGASSDRVSSLVVTEAATA